MLRIPKRPATSASASVSTFAITRRPARAPASLTSSGATARHGPHQVAQKSTSTGRGESNKLIEFGGLRNGNGLGERDERTLACSTPRPPIQACRGHAVRCRARGALNNQSSTNVRPEARTSRRRTATRLGIGRCANWKGQMPVRHATANARSSFTPTRVLPYLRTIFPYLRTKRTDRVGSKRLRRRSVAHAASSDRHMQCPHRGLAR
jgi:hypothetical protein